MLRRRITQRKPMRDVKLNVFTTDDDVVRDFYRMSTETNSVHRSNCERR